MTQKDRIETREMIVTTLQGWHSETVLREITTNKALDNIDKNFTRLNGKVAEHEIWIAKNSSQVGCIPEIRDNMISGKAVRNAIIISITSTGTVFGILFILFKLFIEN